MVVYGRYIGSIYVMFDNEGNPKYNTYDNQFTNVYGKELKKGICDIISKNLETIPLETRIYIRKKHEEHNLRFSCFKTLEANPDRYDKALYIFQIYTKSITTLGSIEDRNNNLIPEVELARKNAVNDMLKYLDNRYAPKTYPYIVWFENPLKYTYLRETQHEGRKPTKNKIIFGNQHSIVGYEVNRIGGDTKYRVFWLKTYDRDIEPNGVYKNHAPSEAVYPDSIIVGKESKFFYR